MSEFKCPVCEDTFASKFSLTRHIARFHKSEKRSRHRCNKCYYSTTKQSNMKRHLMQHLFKCELCHEQFSTKTRLRKHKKDTHPNHISVSEGLNT